MGLSVSDGGEGGDVDDGLILPWILDRGDSISLIMIQLAL
jgi:hypothetical protein